MSARKAVDFGSLHSSTREQFAAFALYGFLVTLWLACGTRTPSTPNVVASTFLPTWLLLWISYYYRQVSIYILIFIISWMGIYATHGWRVRHWLGPSQSIDPTSALGKICAQMAEEAAVGSVQFLITQRPSQNSLAYGFPGRRTICFGRSLKTIIQIEPEKANFAVAHEISHLRHSDVDIGYLSWSLYWSITVLTLTVATSTLVNIPLVIIAFPELNIFAVFQDAAGALAAFSGIIFIANLYFSGALRSREHYADVAAQELTNAKVSIDAMFLGKTEGNWLTKFVRHHPTDRQRRVYLKNPTMLLRVNGGEALSTSFVCGFLFYIFSDIYTEFEIGQANLIKNSLYDPLVSFVVKPSTWGLGLGLMIILVGSLMSSQHLRIATRRAMRFSTRRQFIVEEATMLVTGVLGFSLAFYFNPVLLYETIGNGTYNLGDIGSRTILVVAGALPFGALFILVDSLYAWAIWFVIRDKVVYALTPLQRAALSILWFFSALEFGGALIPLFPSIYPLPYELIELTPTQFWIPVLTSIILGAMTMLMVSAVVVSGTRGAKPKN